MKKHVLSIFLVIYGIFSYGGIKNNNENIYETIKKDLLSNPLDFHERNQKIFDNFVKKIENEKIFLKDHVLMVETLEKESPIFILKECGELCCILTRSINPELRKVAEDKIVSLFDQKIIEKNKEPIHCVSFGSGALFQELVIFTKVLSKHPTAHLMIHMIDHVYEKSNDLTEQLDKETKRKSENLSFFMQRMFIQFQDCLIRMFPDSKITVYQHPYIDDYFNFLKEKNFSRADIVFGIDIGLYPVNNRDPLQDYFSLCISTIIKNSSSLNLLLHNRNIVQLFLENGENRRKLPPIKLENDKELNIYYAENYIEKIKK